MKDFLIRFGAIRIMGTAERIRRWYSDPRNQKTIIGWLEEVYFPEYDFVSKAKIDTGAKNSSMHALDMEYIEQQGKPEHSRIRFKTTDLNGRSQIMEADVLRQVRIKKAGSLAETRPEIELEIILGGVRKRIRINLTDRAGMNYRMILGRTGLKGDFVVDVSKKFATESSCGKE
jgi:hypothetical protein